MNESVIKGKKIITIISVVMVIITLLGLISSNITGDVRLISLVRPIITLIFTLFLYLGKDWARVIIVVWSSIGGVLIMFAAIIALVDNPPVAIISIIIAILNITLAIILGVNTSIKEYFNFCKN